MSDNPYSGPPVDSPKLPVNEGLVHTPKEFSDTLTLELTDSEIQSALKIVLGVKRRHEGIIRSKLRHGNFTVEEAMKLVDDMEAELIEKLATNLDLIATVDATPVFEGQPPIIDLIGALPSHSSAQYGFDHEKKEWEVKKAQDRGEAFLGAGNLE